MEQCILDCQKFVKAHKNTIGLEKCIELCQLCIGACAECLASCEAVRLDRGKMMHTCIELCQSCATECEKHNIEDCRQCADSCTKCVEELSHVIA